MRAFGLTWILFIIVYAFIVREVSSRNVAHPAIPKKIWAFWNNPDNIPHFIQSCIQNWRTMNPDYVINVLNTDNMDNFINREKPKNFGKLAAQGKADWVRMALILEHGGIWLDASTILTNSLAWVLNVQQDEDTEGVIYYLNSWTQNKDFPMLENWFIAAGPGSPFIEAWLVEFEFIVDRFTNHGRLYSLHLVKRFGVGQFRRILQGINPVWGMEYLTQHLAQQKLMHIDGVMPNFSLMEAESGPYLISSAVAGWDQLKTADALMTDRSHSDILSNPPYLVKINGDQRKYILREIRLRATDSNSILRSYLSI